MKVCHYEELIPETPRTSIYYGIERFKRVPHLVPHYADVDIIMPHYADIDYIVSRLLTRLQNLQAYTEKNIFPFPFTLNGI